MLETPWDAFSLPTNSIWDEYSAFLTFSPWQSEDRGAVPCDSRENPVGITSSHHGCAKGDVSWHFAARNIFKANFFLPSGWEHWDGKAAGAGKSPQNPSSSQRVKNIQKKRKFLGALSKEKEYFNFFYQSWGFILPRKQKFVPLCPLLQPGKESWVRIPHGTELRCVNGI